MKLIKKLQSERDGSRMRTYGLYECAGCHTHVKRRIDVVKRAKTSLCVDCLSRGRQVDNAKSYHPLYNTWRHAQSRCTDKNNIDYASYGARGITFYNDWKDFDTWLIYVSNLDNYNTNRTLDRIENNGNYEPGNLRWATKTEQCLNRRKFKNSTSKHKGISKHSGGRWAVYGPMKKYLGLADTEEEGLKMQENNTDEDEWAFDAVQSELDAIADAKYEQMRDEEMGL